VRFERDTVEGWWKDLTAKGVSLKRDMLWGFSFVGESEAVFQPLIPLLEAEGYEYVTIFRDEGEEPYLHVQRVELTTPTALHARVLALHELGAEAGVEFDGWDVGNVDGAGLY
jgi:hypothetical protein